MERLEHWLLVWRAVSLATSSEVLLLASVVDIALIGLGLFDSRALYLLLPFSSIAALRYKQREDN